jgi:hypothetical protein
MSGSACFGFEFLGCGVPEFFGGRIFRVQVSRLVDFEF